MAESLEDIINDLADCCYIYGNRFNPFLTVEENRKAFVAEAVDRIRAAMAAEISKDCTTNEVIHVQV